MTNAVVNSVNKDLGILGITLLMPNANQRNAGIVAKVMLRTIVGTIRNISVMQGTNGLYVLTPSKNIGGQWYSDVTLDRKVQSHILSYVESTLNIPRAEK